MIIGQWEIHIKIIKKNSKLILVPQDFGTNGLESLKQPDNKNTK